ncbi:Kae1-associated serine/threonine protein kinase [archaeon]|jgi:Kae1-associated kinase Bud32|nr:Kae1-associated serine/threonine protein kinase [archaeon]MBT4022969.1 Kae1-associated serine/threonine protein kinase [archaeon]MBT4271960.1 Kae1-associated serine/threonine protein kinase [archaeon]MBT4461798.1 Kae1-associated serine/threonine protein kinase [archaeon]MBT4858187.1 Kae1-associated serine/threonine protein kinase [archaeon]
MTLIGKGAEAEIFKEDNIVIKKRIKKNYRIKEIDLPLRKTRTRREAKILEKLPKEIPAPKLIQLDDKNMEIKMSFIKGKKIRDILEGDLNLCLEIGEKLALMHNSEIIHGDLTTSNMIYDNNVYFIDFGLSYFSKKIEDKAVDLHLIKQALESKHHTIFEKAFSLVLKGYKNKSKNYNEVITRLEKVESRGRNKKK